MAERTTRGQDRTVKPPASRLFKNERAFQNEVVKNARELGWLVGFTWNSKWAPAGEPDLRMVHKFTGRVIFAELKMAENAKLTEGRLGGAKGDQWLDGQDEWMNALKLSQAEYYFWKPSHYESGEILEVLQG
jgi:hypothetical protein